MNLKKVGVYSTLWLYTFIPYTYLKEAPYPFGSAYVMSGMTVPEELLPKDVDVLCLVKEEDLGKINQLLIDQGFVNNSEIYISPEFLSYKRGEFNIIITANELLYQRQAAASSLCKELHILDKKQRIFLHQWMEDWVPAPSTPVSENISF